MASLKEQISEDTKQAMRDRDKPRLAVLRMIQAAFKQKEVDERIALDEVQTLAILEKLVKQRREAITQFAKGGRDDLVAKETFEMEVIQAYLPIPLSDSELETLIRDAITATGALAVKDMGQVMAVLKPKVQGRADMKQMSEKIKSLLN